MSDTLPRKGDTGNARFVTGCAHREVNERNPKLADIPLVVADDSAQQRMDEGLVFEEQVFNELCRLHRCSNLRDRDDTEEETVKAMLRGDLIIVGPTLPTINHRSGRPDLLLRYGASPLPTGNWAYLPVDVKNSSPFEGTAKGCEWRVSGLNNPWLENSAVETFNKSKTKKDQSLQLAHYWLMLKDLGHAPEIPSNGATINPGIGVVWRDLDDPSDSYVATAIAEWHRRWAAINAMRDGEELLTRPFLHGNCETCVWRDFCEEIIIEEQHVSLLSGIGEAAVSKLAAVGIHSIPQLAACNPTAGTLKELKMTKTLSGAIDSARVLLSGAKIPFTPRDATNVYVPRADVEIDFDVENDGSDFLYLYGCHVSRRISNDKWTDGEYLSFHTFVRNDPLEEARLLADFWRWLNATVSQTEAAGQTIAVYCYSGDIAELPRMREVVTRHPTYPELPSIDDVNNLGTQPWWVDMYKITKNLVWPTRKLGLKYVAPLAGFSWDAEDAGGANSIQWFRIASDPSHPEALTMAEKLLRYNADDVLATKYLRHWLDDGASGRTWHIPSVTSLD